MGPYWAILSYYLQSLPFSVVTSLPKGSAPNFMEKPIKIRPMDNFEMDSFREIRVIKINDRGEIVAQVPQFKVQIEKRPPIWSILVGFQPKTVRAWGVRIGYYDTSYIVNLEIAERKPRPDMSPLIPTHNASSFWYLKIFSAVIYHFHNWCN